MTATSTGQSPGTIDVGSGFLTKEDFERHWTTLFPRTEDTQTPPLKTDIMQASVDLHLGSEYYLANMAAPGHLSDTAEYVTIPHGEFALLITREFLNIPTNILGLMTMKIKYKGTGLINVSGFHVDPGFSGQFFYSVYNAGPTDMKLKWKEPVFTIFLATLAQPTSGYEGDHQGQQGLPPDLVSELGRPPVNIVKLDERLIEVETTMKIYFAIAASLLLILISGVVAGVVTLVLGWL